VPPYPSAWAWFTPRDHRSFLLKLVFERARLTQREEQDGQRCVSGGGINQPVAGVGLCQTFPWGSRGSHRGCFFKPEFAARGLSTNPRPHSGSKKGPGTRKGHAGPSGSGGEEPAGRCDGSAHRCQLCWSRLGKPGCRRQLGDAQEDARLLLRRDPSEMGCAGRVGRPRRDKKNSQKSSAAKLTSPDMPQSTSHWEPRLEKSL